MKVAFTGSQELSAEKVLQELTELNSTNFELIIHGGAIGVDTIVNNFYQGKHKIKVIKPNYPLHKKSALLIRNIFIVDECDMLIAFGNGVSQETKQIIDYAIKCQKTVIIKEMRAT